jgi:hypothetical protein
MLRRYPVGVVGVISPFNVLLILSTRSIAPALALGNAVVVKPDIRTPIAGGFIQARVLEEAGLPAGVLHVNTHAVQSERTPSASLLLLANGATDMAAFATLPLRGALVVLSACESAGGSLAHGEGTKGLLFGVFGAGVNVTLGLPIIRTSVDHGTALELSGTGKADIGSLVAAIKLASALAAGRGARASVA